ncbi:hypothetical protein M3Y99_00328200 [Aphelenchoides fujianensis]|nr:hypothetical protein M3Y99_00328200 [Aphelenchoides fujianensis]
MDSPDVDYELVLAAVLWSAAMFAVLPASSSAPTKSRRRLRSGPRGPKFVRAGHYAPIGAPGFVLPTDTPPRRPKESTCLSRDEQKNEKAADDSKKAEVNVEPNESADALKTAEQKKSSKSLKEASTQKETKIGAKEENSSASKASRKELDVTQNDVIGEKKPSVKLVVNVSANATAKEESNKEDKTGDEKEVSAQSFTGESTQMSDAKIESSG